MKRLLFLLPIFTVIFLAIYATRSNQVQRQFIVIPDTAYRAVYLVPDPEAASATAHLIVQAGEVDTDGPEGLAHYLEHLAWLDVFQKSGQSADRHANAWTNANATVYRE